MLTSLQDAWGPSTIGALEINAASFGQTWYPILTYTGNLAAHGYQRRRLRWLIEHDHILKLVSPGR